MQFGVFQELSLKGNTIFMVKTVYVLAFKQGIRSEILDRLIAEPFWGFQLVNGTTVTLLSHSSVSHPFFYSLSFWAAAPVGDEVL